MSTHIFRSHLFKQAVGAVAGMAAATALYFGVQAVSDLRLPALIVGGNPTVSENAGEVRVNQETVDEEMLARLQSRAQEVALLQESEVQPPVAATTIEPETRDQVRSDARRRMLERLTAVTAPTARDVRLAERRQTIAEKADGEMHSGAQLDVPVQPRRLADAGLGTQSIALLALLLVIGLRYRGDLWRRFVARMMSDRV